MLVVVNQPHADSFTIEGRISSPVLEMLKTYYGDCLKIKDSDWVNIENTDWYKEMKETYSPSSNLAFYRKEKKLTQATLGNILGVPKQNVSDMEHGRRPISKEMTKKIASAPGYPVTLFI